MRSVPAFVCFVTLTWSLVGSPASAAPNDWAEGSPDSNDGATRTFYNRGAALRWEGAAGDWLDRNGERWGEEPWTETRVADTNTSRPVDWDVTELVRAWVSGEIQNQGFFLRPLTGSGTTRFHSRQGAEASRHPRLSVEVDADTLTFEAEADTIITQTTHRALGTGERLSVGGDRVMLLRFDLSDIAPDANVTGATLTLTTTERQYGGTDIGVFAASPGRTGPLPPVEHGIAEELDHDEGLADHPDVILLEDFEAEDWLSHWSGSRGNYDVVDADEEHGLEPLQGRALRVLIPEDGKTGLNFGFRFMEKIGEEPEEIYFRYYIRLGNDWNQTVDGGKLPGVSGTYGNAGWGGRRSDGTNGWSARGSFRTTVPVDGNPLGGRTAIGNYVYHADMAGFYGDQLYWVEDWGVEGHGGVLSTEVWYCLEMHVRMNTPGENDGILRSWVNGRRTLTKTDFRFRDVTDLKIERIWMNVYHGGTARSPYDQHLFIDHLVIARSYVGPMGGTSLPEPSDDPDAGVEPAADGGTDAHHDGGSRSDAGAPPEAGARAEAGRPTDFPMNGGDGCSCRVTAVPRSPILPSLACIVVGVALVRRLRRA